MTARDIVESYESLMRAGDEHGAVGYLADDFVMYEPRSLPYGGVFHGPSGFAEFRLIFQSVWARVDRGDEWIYIQDGDRIARRAVVTGTTRTNGRVVRWRHAELFTVRDSKIVSLEVFYFDTVQIMEALDAR